MLACFKKTPKARFFKHDSFVVRDLRNDMKNTLAHLAVPPDDFSDYAYRYHFLQLLLENYEKEMVRDLSEDVFNYYKQRAEVAILSLGK